MPRGKVVTTLRSRPEIEVALRALARARTEDESRPYLLTLMGYGAAVLPVVLQGLDTLDPWMVRALGRTLAQVQDRRRTAEALRRAILSPRSSDRRRIVAMVLLDQFLEEPLDENLFAALGNPTDVAVRALLGETPAGNHLVRLDYLSIIHAQSPLDIASALGRFREAASDEAIAALAFFALDERDEIAQQALESLGMIRLPAARQALRNLEPSVPPSRRSLLERMQRKLLLGGVPELPRPAPPVGARILVSPLDGAGNRLLLFLFPEKESYRTLHLFLDDTQGVGGAYEVTYSQQEIPAATAVGSVHPAPRPWEGIFLLGASWGYARRLLQEYLVYNETRETLCPLEYRFFHPQIWGWEAEEEERPAWPGLPGGLSQSAVSLLLGHRYLASWFVESEAIYGMAQTVLQADLSRPEGQGLLALATVSLVQSEFPPEACLRYARRLRDMAEWLLRAGEASLAAVAAGAAEELDRVQPLQSIFALLLLQKGLLLAVGNLQQAGDLG
jgi:hypothetical protein